MCSVNSGVERETGPWRTSPCCLSPETAWCQEKEHVKVVYKGVCFLSSRGAHLANGVHIIQICLLWERRGDLTSSVSCCWVRVRALRWLPDVSCTFNISAVSQSCLWCTLLGLSLRILHRHWKRVLIVSVSWILLFVLPIILQAESSGSFSGCLCAMYALNRS